MTRGGAVAQRAVDDVAVARHPADVGGTPVHVLFAEIEDPLVSERHAEKIAGRRVQDALGFAGRAAGVQDEERMLAVERLGGQSAEASAISSCHQQIAARLSCPLADCSD